MPLRQSVNPENPKRAQEKLKALNALAPSANSSPQKTVKLPMPLRQSVNPENSKWAQEKLKALNAIAATLQEFLACVDCLKQAHDCLYACAKPSGSQDGLVEWSDLYDLALQIASEAELLSQDYEPLIHKPLVDLYLLHTKLASCRDNHAKAALGYLSGAEGFAWKTAPRNKDFWSNIKKLRALAHQAIGLYGNMAPESFAFADFVCMLTMQGHKQISLGQNGSLQFADFEDEIDNLGLWEWFSNNRNSLTFDELTQAVCANGSNPSPSDLLYCILLWMHYVEERRERVCAFLMCLNENAMRYMARLKEGAYEIVGGRDNDKPADRLVTLVSAIAGRVPCDGPSARLLFPELMQMLGMFKEGSKITVKDMSALQALLDDANNVDVWLDNRRESFGSVRKTPCVFEATIDCVTIRDTSSFVTGI